MTDDALRLAIYTGENVPDGWTRGHWRGSTEPHIGRYWPPTGPEHRNLRRSGQVEVQPDGWVRIMLQDGPRQHNRAVRRASVVDAMAFATGIMDRWHSGAISTEAANVAIGPRWEAP